MSRTFTLFLACATATTAFAKGGVDTRLILSLGGGVGHIWSGGHCEYCPDTFGPASEIGLGLEVASRYVALEVGGRLLVATNGRTESAPAALIAARLTPWRAIIEIGGGIAHLSGGDSNDEGHFSGGAMLLHGAVGARVSDHFRLLVPFDLMDRRRGPGTAIFVGLIAEAAIGAPPQ